MTSQGLADTGRRLIRLALGLLDRNPDKVQRSWSDDPGRPEWGPWSAFSWKMALVDPGPARRAIEGLPWTRTYPEVFVYLALGCGTGISPPPATVLDEGLRRIDRLMQERPERSLLRAGAVAADHRTDRPVAGARGLLARRGLAAAVRQSAHDQRLLPELADLRHLAWYDREVAAAMFEPIRARMEHTEDRRAGDWGCEFQAWSLFDPRAAVARLERVPVNPEPLTARTPPGSPWPPRSGCPIGGDGRRPGKEWEIILGGSGKRR